MCVCVCVFTCGLLRVVTHEAEPASLFLTEAKQVKETNLLQLDLETVHVLKTEGKEKKQSLNCPLNIFKLPSRDATDCVGALIDIRWQATSVAPYETETK